MSNQKPPGASRSTDCTKQAENNTMMEEDPDCEPPPGSVAQICEQDGGSPCEAEGAAGHSTSTAPDVLTMVEKRNFQLPPSFDGPSSSDDIKKENVAKEQATILLGAPSKDDVSPKNSAQGECINPKSHDQTLDGKSEPGLPLVTYGQQAVVASARTVDSFNCPPDGLPFMPYDFNSGGNKHPGEISPHIPNKPKTPKRSSPKQNRSRESARCERKSGVNQAPADTRVHSDGGERSSPQCLSSSQHTDPAPQASRTRQIQARNDGAERGARSPPTDEQAKPEEEAPSSTKVADEQTHKNKERVASHQKQGDSACSSVPSDVSHNESRTSLKSVMDELGLGGQHEIVTSGGKAIFEVNTETTSGERSPETRPLQQSPPQSTLQSDAQLGASASCSTHEQTTNKQTTSQTENNAAPDRASKQSPCTQGSLLSQNRVPQAASQPPSGAGPVQVSASPLPSSRRQPTPDRQPPSASLQSGRSQGTLSVPAGQAQSEHTSPSASLQSGRSQGTLSVPAGQAQSEHTSPSASLQSGRSQGTPSRPVLSLRSHRIAVPAGQSPNSQQRAVQVQRPAPQSSQPRGTSARPRGRGGQGRGLRPRGNCSILTHHSRRQRHEDQQGSRNTHSVFVVDLEQQAVDMTEHQDLNVDARDLLTDISLHLSRLPREITEVGVLVFRSWGPHPETTAGTAERAGLPARFQRFLDEGQVGDFAAFIASLTPGGTAVVLCVVCQIQEVNVHLFPCHHRPLCRLCLVRDRLCRCPLQHCCRLIVFFFQFRH